MGHTTSMWVTASSAIPHNWYNRYTSSLNTFFWCYLWTMLHLEQQKFHFPPPFSSTFFSTNPIIFCPLIHLLLFWTARVAFFNDICFVFYFDVLLYSRTSLLPTSASMFSLDVCRHFLRPFTSICTQCSSPVNFLPPSALLKHNLSTSTFWWCARYTVNSFPVFPIRNNIWLLTLPYVNSFYYVSTIKLGS